MKDYPQLLPGDIFGVKGKGILRWFCEHFLEPTTDRVHFGIIGDYLIWDDDYIILESIGKGIAVGRLSFYKRSEIEIYRVDLSKKPEWKKDEVLLRRRAAAELSRVGRARYDYILCAQLALGAIGLLIKGYLPPWKSEEFPYGRNRSYICTEAAVAAWYGIGIEIVNKNAVPTPASIKEADVNGIIYRVYPERL